MRAGSLIALGLLAACGPGLAQTASVTPPVRAGVPPPSDEVGLRALPAHQVVSGGLWFADETCQTRFGSAGTIVPEAFDAFAHCVAGLHLRPTGRVDSFDDTSVLTDEVGFEIEARVVAGRLDYIGFSGRGPGMPDMPTITRETLESLRASGDPNASVSAKDADELGLSSKPPPRTEHLRVCLAETGEVNKIMPGTTMTFASATAFAAVAQGWRFRPFTIAGKPMAVCSIVTFHYPAGTHDPARLPRPPQLSKAGNIVYYVNPMELETLRIAGTKMVTPDGEDKTHLQGKRIVGSFKLCLDETGHYESGVLLKTTGVPRYDAKIARTLMEWAFQPYVVGGTAIPVCSAFTFIYTQN